MSQYNARGHLIILFCVLIFGGIALSSHVTMLGLSLWLAAILFTAFAPLLFSLLARWLA